MSHSTPASTVSIDTPISTKFIDSVNPAIKVAVSAAAPAGPTFDAGTQAGTSTFPKPQLLYFRLKAIQSPTSVASTFKFPSSNTLCPILLQQLSTIPCLNDTGLFTAGKIQIMISKHASDSSRSFLYTAALSTPSTPGSLGSIADLILSAQDVINAESPTTKGFLFSFPIITPQGTISSPTRCCFAYDRNLLLSLTTVDFQLKIPTSISISPAADFALLVAQLITPPAAMPEADYLAATLADRTRFEGFCREPKNISSKYGDYIDELLSGTFTLNFEDPDSRDVYIWSRLIFASIFGLDPRFGNHQQFHLYIPILNDSRQLDRRPLPMKNAVSRLKSNHDIIALLPSKPLRNRPKPSEASTSESECETLFLENIGRRAEALLLLPPVPPFDTLLALQYIPLNDITFTHVLKIPAAPLAVIIPAASPSAIIESNSSAALAPHEQDLPLPFDCKTPPPTSVSQSFTYSLHPHPRSHHPSASLRLGKLDATATSKDPAQITLNGFPPPPSLSVMASETFRGEGKRDILCIKFSEFRCQKGSHCPYSHDLRGLIAALQRTGPTIFSPIAASNVTGRAQNASPTCGGRGDTQFEKYLNALERSRSKIDPRDSSLLTDPVRAVIEILSSPKSPISLPPHFTGLSSSPVLSSLNALSLITFNTFANLSHPSPTPPLQLVIPLKTPLPLSQPTKITAARLELTTSFRAGRSLPSDPIAELNGYCSMGHRIFRRSTLKKGSRCSFCKSTSDTLFTCTCSSQHSCHSCLTGHKTATAPPPCGVPHCPGKCSIFSLKRPSNCWDDGHSIDKGAKVWNCSVCKFMLCQNYLTAHPTSTGRPFTAPKTSPPSSPVRALSQSSPPSSILKTELIKTEPSALSASLL
jgi:hypothetical protein